MKKILSILSILFLLLVVCSCTQKEKLYVINVGDYINDELVKRFEEEYNCEVVYTETNSNEEIYQKLKNETYDICIVSDYLIDRMYQEGLIQKIDFNKLSNYHINKLDSGNYKIEELFDESFNNGSSDALKLLNDVAKDSYIEYFIPYFWGTVGILYNTEIEGLEDDLYEYGLSILFSENDYNKGMYNSSRDSLCMSLIAYNYTNDTNIDINTASYNELRKGCDLIKNTTYRAWGDDNLKSLVRNGTLDIAMVYSGDYMDELYQCESDGLCEEDINFNYYAPDDTNIWFDGMVITSQCQNEDLAYKFLDYFQDKDICAENADYIGYFPMNKYAFEVLCNEYEDYYLIDENMNFLEEVDESDPYIVFTKDRMKYAYKYISSEHYNWLNDLLDEAKSK